MTDLGSIHVERAPGGPESEFDESYDDWREEASSTFTSATLSEPLGSVTRRALVTVETTATIAETIHAMNESHVGAALIVQNGRLTGIFTERDVLTKVAAAHLDIDATPVTRVMTPDPETLPASASIAYAMHRMSVEGYRHVPLVDDEHRPLGVVAVRDIVAWMCELFPASILNLPPEPGYPKSVDGG